MESHDQLPKEILIHILSRLSPASTIQSKLVCRAWRSIIEDTFFHYMQIRHRLISDNDNNCSATGLDFVTWGTANKCCFYTNYVSSTEYKYYGQRVMRFKQWKLPFKDHSYSIHTSLAIIGSSNGLICLSTTCDYDINGSHHTLVCNPLTHEIVNLSDSSINSSSSSSSTDEHELINYSSLSLVRIGFGYLLSTNEHKIVRMYTSKQDGRIKHVQVYTLGSSGRWRSIVPQISSSWSDISFLPVPRYAYHHDISFSPIPRSGNHHVFNLGVSVNGALYFNNYCNIVSFDLAKEEFRIIVSPPPPPTPFTIDTGIGGLGVLEGRLCATYSRCLITSSARSRSTSTMINTDLWVLMDDDNKEMKVFPWIKKYSLPPQREEGAGMYHFYGYRPLGTISPLILLQPNPTYPSVVKGIVTYNPETDHLCCREIVGGNKSVLIPYVKSCVSLKALGEDTTKKNNLSCCR